MDCLFCKIINKEIPSKVVYEDDNVLGFLDISPVSTGHTLIIPKTHSSALSDGNDNDISKMLRAAKKVSNKIYDKFKADGINFLINEKAPAGQVVFHLHLHIIPKYLDKGGFILGKKVEENQDLEAIHKTLIS
ncbi:HIT family protein [Spiroplasma endosymbiont of Anurida maritima]|uniref:HIT family protein n=1 Tax=Spiroplasma endosymbiont of Anurida maritima TaxID=2967972 RepID=UPI0036D30D57